MPDEPQEINKKPSDTPHFNEFSGHGNAESTQFEPMVDNTPPVEPKIMSPAVAPTIQPSAGFTPFPPEPVDKPTESQQPSQVFAPAPVVDPVPASLSNPAPVIASGPSPSNMRISDTTISQQPIQTSKPSGFSGFLKNKKLVIGIVIAFLIVLIGGGSTFAFVSNYQKPQNVVNDALMNALVAKSATYSGKISYDFGTDSSKLKAVVEIDSQTGIAGTQHHNAKLNLTVGTKSYSIQGDALFDKVGDVYFRVQGLKSVIDDAKSNLGITSGDQLSNSINGIVKKIDGTWVRISTEDLDKYDKNFSKVKKCINESIDKFKNDNSAITEVADLYRKNPFVVVKKDLGNFEYNVITDTKAGKAFAISLKTTKIYKSLNTCDKSIVINDKDVNSISEENTSTDANIQPTYKLSVDSWSHKINKFNVSYNSDVFVFSANITPDYSQKVDIATPKPSISITQLQTYIEELTQATYSTPSSIDQTTQNAKTAQAQSNARSAITVADTFNWDYDFYPGTTAAFYFDENYKQLTGVNILPNVSSITSANGQDSVAWSCLNVCAYTKGGRIAYFDYTTNTVAYLYAGTATSNDNFVNSQ